MRPAVTIMTELVRLGAPFTAAQNITKNTISRYFRDATTLNNTSRRDPDITDAPADDLFGQLRGDETTAAGVITAALIRVTRAHGGDNCPEVGLPMAYAAEAVILARRAASH